ncbi:hypothetical protein [Loigolactobacillus zhaoyuanensis]|uniref:hypothetical protein n=1 Tax=Loigolactobacillus zhaoyuanensis TaxID=2486017 RepID=UPI000F73CD4C|nr:hypothetical protein [Loigolactobacillus zhaoyuanensis]
MKFITEHEIKFHYKQAPFKTYYLADNCRLTPEARQFLSDHRIDLAKQVLVPEAKAEEVTIPTEVTTRRNQLLYNMIRIDFYEIALLMKPVDSQFSQSLFKTAEALTNDTVDTKLVEFTNSKGFTLKQDAFKISYFHVLSQYGALIIKLAHTGSAIELLACELPQQEQQTVKQILTQLAWMMDQLMRKEK